MLCMTALRGYDKDSDTLNFTLSVLCCYFTDAWTLMHLVYLQIIPLPWETRLLLAFLVL